MTIQASLADNLAAPIHPGGTGEQRLMAIFKSISEILNLFVLLLGVSAIAGWVFDIAFLKSVLPGSSAIKVNAASGLILLSASLWMVQSKRALSPACRFASRLCSSAAILIGAVTLLEYIGGWDFGIDQLFIKESPGALFTTYPGRPSPLTALNMVLAGLAILTIDARDWRGIQPGHAALFLVGITSLLTFLGHLHGVPHFLHFLPGSSAIAFNAAFGLLALTVAILFANPGRGITAILVSDTAGGVLARRMLFPSVIFMIVFDYALNAGEKAGFYDADSVPAIHNTLLIVFFTGIIIATAKLLERADIRRTAARDEMLQSEARYRELFENASDFVYTSGLDGIFTSVNRALCERSGYRAEELIGFPFGKIVPPASIEEARKMTEAKLKGEISRTRYEIEIISKNGEVIPIELNTRLIIENGKPVGIQGIGRDIGERKQREKNISFEMHDLREVVESNTDIFYIHNIEGKLIKWNKALEKLTGLSRRELMLKPALEFVCEGDRPLVLQRMGEVFEKGFSAVEARFISADGTLVPFLCNGYVLKDMNGTVTGFAGTGRDISGRKAAEEKLKAAKEAAETATLLKDKFISLLFHDLRSPLASIILLQKITMSSHKGSRCAECKTSLEKSVGICESMLQMTDDLLESARLQGGAIRLNRKICNVRDICGTVMDDLNYLAEKKEVAFKNEVPHGARLYVDRGLFQRVIHNLVVNALKFSGKGAIVTAFLSGGQNVLAVKDTGTGISGELLPDLFKHEVKTSTIGTAGERGSGFGLPMSMDIMKAHGGTIRVTSRNGEGTVFFAEVPDMKPLVLVADDDDVLLFTIRKYLENIGAEMVMAKNGAEAFTIALDKTPALIITDLKMPVMDGLALLQKLKNSAKHSHIPVLIMTGSHTNDIELRKKAFEYKADDFITKPLSEPDFIPRINRFIAG